MLFAYIASSCENEEYSDVRIYTQGHAHHALLCPCSRLAPSVTNGQHATIVSDEFGQASKI